MDIDEDRWRALFESATAGFVELTDGVGDDQWEAPGLGVWTVRDLVGHTSRALLTIEMYLAREAETITLDSPVAYFLRSATGGSPEIAREAADAIAQRGRDAGAALGPEPAEAVRAIADRVIALVDRTADDAPIATPAGGITLAAYLPTRVYELTVHGLDIAAAIGAPSPERFEDPVAACLDLAAETIGVTPGAAGVLLALNGRTSLPEGFHVI